MPTKTRDGYPVQVSLAQEDLKKLQAAADKMDLSQSELSRRGLRAFVEALAANDYRMSLPLKLQIILDPLAGKPPAKSGSNT